jgi:A/G-specific adenine glycosylase
VNRALRDWYGERRDRYPWRRRPDPYRVLVSEVMLQQTQASRVGPAFERFVRAFPDAASLAAASPADVLRAWGSLGYNRRAVALHAAAREIVSRHGGRVPVEVDVLRTLPGVGPYTAAAVASIAGGAVVPAVDTNVARVVRRVRLGTDAATRREVDAAARSWIDRADPAAWNQALMDVGREHCRPQPRCVACPLARGCRFRRAGALPIASSRKQPPFPGSFRQVRGAVVRALRASPSATLAALARDLGEPVPRVAEAVAALSAEGVIRAGSAALAGRPGGRVRLPG